MSYYYVTNTYDVYKKVGARHVKLIYSLDAIKQFELLAKNRNNLDARIPKVVIPMIRRTFPKLIASEIVGVQPMTGPIGLAFTQLQNYNSPKYLYVPSKECWVGSYKKRNNIPLHVFKKKYTSILETPNFCDVIFELSSKNL